MRVGLYARMSRDDLGDSLGVDRQTQDCEALASRRDWTIAQRYVDNDVSAFSGRSRPAYERLVADLSTGQINAVIAWAPERLHRSPRELEDFIELLERTGAAVETVKAGAWDVSTSHGRLVARMLGAVSRAESERTGERVARAHRQAKEAGRWRGPIPFGMRRSDQPGLPEPDPATADTVADIFERVTRGDALTKIARDLTARGVRPRRGQRWTHTGIARLMASPALGGLIDLDGTLEKAAFEGVVSAADWREANASLRRRPRGESRRPREKLTLLGGILTCTEHGHTLVGSSAAHGSTYCAGQPGECYVSIKRAPADEFIEAVILGRLRRPDAADLFVATDDPNDDHVLAADIRHRREELLDLIAAGVITAADARTQLEGLGAELAHLEHEPEPRLINERVLGDPAAVWQEWTMPQRRAVVRLLFDALTIKHVGPGGGPRADPTRIHVKWAST